jgi:hypothetical protein
MKHARTHTWRLSTILANATHLQPYQPLNPRLITHLPRRCYSTHHLRPSSRLRIPINQACSKLQIQIHTSSLLRQRPRVPTSSWSAQVSDSSILPTLLLQKSLQRKQCIIAVDFNSGQHLDRPWMLHDDLRHHPEILAAFEERRASSMTLLRRRIFVVTDDFP